MLQTIDTKEQWKEAFAQAGFTDVLSPLRLEALATFEALGFPNKRHEEWKYSDPKRIATTAFSHQASGHLSKADVDALHVPDLTGNVLYFENGRYRADLSQIVSTEKGIQVLSFKEALAKHPALMQEHVGRYAPHQAEAFTALNTALAEDGVVVVVPDNVTVDAPVILRFIADARSESPAIQVRNLVLVGKNAEVMVAEAYRSLGKQVAFTNVVTEISVGADARVDYYKVQNEADTASHVGLTQVYQKDRSYFYAATFTLNGGYVRNNLHLVLDGQHIDSHMYGLYIPNERQHVDNHTLVDHQMPNSISNELYKGILNDRAVGVFNGKIFVREDAQKTNAYQNCRNVLLSDTASMNTKPQLEIWADDVKCSHGTTTGQLDDEAIFYMQSRGIPRKEAIRLQLLAFAEDVVAKIKLESLQHYLEECIKQKLSV